MPFEAAAGELAFFWQVELSEATVRRHAYAAGTAYCAVQAAEVERIEREQPSVPPGPPLQQVSVDGAMVPLVGGQWAEVKTLAIGTVRPPRRDPKTGTWEVHAEELSYFSRRAEHETFARLATAETHRRGVETAGVVCGVADGADWCQAFLDLHRPDAVRILDFPHALQHLAAAGQATFGAGSAAAGAWLAEQAHALEHGTPEAVLAALRALPAGQARDPATAAEVRAATLGYLEKRRGQIRYAEFRARGYPIGSGAVESANKLVVEARLKGAGMHWASEHVDPMVALRTITCSGRWAAAWPQVVAALRARVGRRRAARRRARRAAPAAATLPPSPCRPAPNAPLRLPPSRATPTIVNGRPTADHPWKKRPLLASGRTCVASNTSNAKS